MISELWARWTRRTPEQNSALVRWGCVDRTRWGWAYPSFAGRPISVEFGPPPAVVFADELAGQSAAELVFGPQRLSPGRVRARVGSRA